MKNSFFPLLLLGAFVLSKRTSTASTPPNTATTANAQVTGQQIVASSTGQAALQNVAEVYGNNLSRNLADAIRQGTTAGDFFASTVGTLPNPTGNFTKRTPEAQEFRNLGASIQFTLSDIKRQQEKLATIRAGTTRWNAINNTLQSDLTTYNNFVAQYGTAGIDAALAAAPKNY